MPVTLSTTADNKLLIVQWADWRGQQRTNRILLKGSVADEDVVEIVDRLDQLSNARMVDVSFVVSFAITGYKAAANSNVPNENIQEFMALNFSGTHPINSRKRVFKTVSIPAPIKAIEDTSGNGRAVGNNTTLNALATTIAPSVKPSAPLPYWTFHRAYKTAREAQFSLIEM
jgi:hypothetical protein